MSTEMEEGKMERTCVERKKQPTCAWMKSQSIVEKRQGGDDSQFVYLYVHMSVCTGQLAVTVTLARR